MPQPEADATYAPKLSREDGRIDWSQPAAGSTARSAPSIPGPARSPRLAGTPLKILAATPVDAAGPPGTVLDDALTVACGIEAIRLTKVQLPGRAALDAGAFLRGHPVPARHHLLGQ